MKRFCFVAACVAASVAPLGALAQPSQSIENAPQAPQQGHAPVPRQPDDLTIDIVASPPPGAVATPAAAPRPVPSTAYVPYPEVAPDEELWAPGNASRQREDTPDEVATSWRRHLVLGMTLGLGAPLGYIGAWADVNVSRWVGFTTGVGSGGTFGPALTLGVNVRPWTWGRWGLYVGSGVSTNFTSGNITRNPAITVPSNSWWWNLEVGMEYRARGGLFLRFGLGYALLLNTGDFTNRDFGGFYGPTDVSSIGFGPIAAADAHDNGVILAFPFVHFDLGGVLNI